MFAVVLFPSLVFLGLVTFERVLESGIEDIIYARSINRIRQLSQEHVPEIQLWWSSSCATHALQSGASSGTLPTVLRPPRSRPQRTALDDADAGPGFMGRDEQVGRRLSHMQPTEGTPAQPSQSPSGDADTPQQVEGEGKVGTHSHPAVMHTHDHYHITHHHRDVPLGEWEHKTSWHTHEHNHGPLTHSHDYTREEEDQHHASEAHVHDHDHPTQ
jgi:hypothetical protein